MTRLTPRRYLLCLGACAALLSGAIIASPGIGSQSATIGWIEAWRAYLNPADHPVAHQIAFHLRLPRTLLAIQVGITLGLCGAVFQALFRNALATPYTLGISSGGSLGALVAIKLGLTSGLLGLSGVTIAAFAAALLVIAILFLFTRGAARLTTHELLLAGVTLGLFCSAMMMLVTYLSSARETFEIIRWMMGSLDTIGGGPSSRLFPILLPAWVILVASARSLNQYALGEDIAATRGVHLARLQAACILAGSMATAAVVAVCGPIGFVGLVVPHATALLVGRDCRLLLPASALVGGVFLAGCDWLSQLAMGWVSALTGQQLGSAILPIGVVTAVVGVPIFLFLLHHRRTGLAER